jgi:hypothetical protein
MSRGLIIEWLKSIGNLNKWWMKWIVTNSKLSHRKGSKILFKWRVSKRTQARGTILNHNLKGQWILSDQICLKHLSHLFKVRGRCSSGRPSLRKKASYFSLSPVPTLSNGNFQPTTTPTQTKRKHASLKTGPWSRTTPKKYTIKINQLAKAKKQNPTRKHTFCKRLCLVTLPLLSSISQSVVISGSKTKEVATHCTSPLPMATTRQPRSSANLASLRI